jgi:glycosyltransferase involved in cell wall biosynthesis
MRSSRIKVLHHLRNLDLGGTEKTCELFLSYLDVKKFELHLAWENGGPRHERFARLHPELKMWRVTREDPSHWNAVVAEIQPDILHVYRSGFPEWPEPGRDVEVPNFVETNVFGFVDRNLQVTKTLFMSKWLMDFAIRGHDNRFDFVNNPVEEPYTNDTYSWREPGAIYLGRCGRPDNGIYNAVSVLAALQLRQQGYDIRFAVVAPPSNMVDDLVKFGIPFHVIPPTVEPLALSMFYNSIDIYAHARADGETFGVNIAEAMMHSKPVVTHIAVPSMPGMGVFQAQTQLVEHGVTGFVCENDPTTYATYLKKLIDSPDVAMAFGGMGSQRAMEQFHAEVCAKKLGGIYEELVCRK